MSIKHFAADVMFSHDFHILCVKFKINDHCRLDAGTFGTMGVGVGFAIAAALWCRDYAPDRRVVCIQGDSAFGFSGFEVETVCR